MSKPFFDKIAICGVGLIGGSFALAAKQAGIVGQVVGLGRSLEPLRQAEKLGVIDSIATDTATAVRDADLVLLAVPVGQMLPVMQSLVPHLPAHAIVTDGGSTKQDVLAAAHAAFDAYLPSKIAQFVPGHPIAGAEKSGVTAATADLYRDKRVVLTPLPENRAQDVDAVQAAWEACGAKVSRLSPHAHDATFAAVSHLPHLLAFALVHEFANRGNADQLFSFAAGGFRDFTRIASSHPEMWRDICVANRHALLGELDAYMNELMRARVMLAEADGAALEQMFALSRERRDAWLDSLAPPGE